MLGSVGAWPAHRTIAFALLGVAIAAIGVMIRRADGAARGDEGGRQGRRRGHVAGSFWFGVNDCELGRRSCRPTWAPTCAPKAASACASSTAGRRGCGRSRRAASRASLTIDKGNCSEWTCRRLGAQPSNRVSMVNGHVRVQCSVGGGTVKANVTFERCGQQPVAGLLPPPASLLSPVARLRRQSRLAPRRR